MADPPPYESVMQGDGNQFFSARDAGAAAAATAAAAAGAGAGASGSRYLPPESELQISVTSPQKHGEGMGTFVTYQVASGPAPGRGASAPSATVARRFRDFAWLSQKLTENNKGVIIPPLPEKSAVQKMKMTSGFIEARRRQLQSFINKVAAHPLLREAPELGTFLRAPDEQWQLEMARWQAEAAAVQVPAMSGALGWLKGLQHSASNMVSGRSDDAMEDPEYIKVRDYVLSLESHVAEVERQVSRLVRKEADLADALSDFGGAGEQLGKFDDGAMRACFDVLSARGGQIAAAAKARVEHLVAKGDFETKKIRLAKLRGTPGLAEAKLSEAERDVAVAEQQVRNTKLEYDTIACRMTEELNRFQKERSHLMSGLMRRFALTQAEFAAENAKGWGALLDDIQTQLGAAPPPATSPTQA